MGIRHVMRNSLNNEYSLDITENDFQKIEKHFIKKSRQSVIKNIMSIILEKN